jgi:3-methyladenine DNA glycosylase AlkC
MAEPLRNYFSTDVPRTIARQIAGVWPAFDTDAFMAGVIVGYDELGLMDRGRHIARRLRAHLPAQYRDALEVLLQSCGERPARSEGDGGMSSFLYLPHVCFVAEYGFDDFDASMRAQHALTQRFTAEFSIRPFIERHPGRTLATLRQWATDPNPHVRRLVSEGTRPRLPWAGRLRDLQRDPQPVLALLELLKDDPDEMVRRSVANNLNDIGKDHPDVLVEVAGRWLDGASPERKRLVAHALRSLVKKGHTSALALLGAGADAVVALERIDITPATVTDDGKVAIAFAIRSTAEEEQRIVADLRVHYVKANGSTSPKVFKLKAADLAPGDVLACRKQLSLRDLTTRRHYAGEHVVEVLLNGRAMALGSFTLVLDGRR